MDLQHRNMQHLDLRGRSLTKETDLSPDEFRYLVDLGEQVRGDKGMGFQHHRLAGCNIVLIFEKASTRTRSAFEVAAHDEGAHVTYIGPGESQLGHKESVRDTARVLGRMFDGIEFRGFAQDAVETLAAWSGVPVWNGLTDAWHPTQMLADILTMRDQRIVGAIADIRLLREHRLFPAPLRHLADMRRVVDAGGVEGARDDRDLQRHIRHLVGLSRGAVCTPGFAADLADRVAVQRAIGRAATGRETNPTHVMPPSVRAQGAGNRDRTPWSPSPGNAASA